MKKFRALALGLAFTFVLGAGAACSRGGDSESAAAETTGTETQAARSEPYRTPSSARSVSSDPTTFYRPFGKTEIHLF